MFFVFFTWRKCDSNRKKQKNEKRRSDKKSCLVYFCPQQHLSAAQCVSPELKATGGDLSLTSPSWSHAPRPQVENTKPPLHNICVKIQIQEPGWTQKWRLDVMETAAWRSSSRDTWNQLVQFGTIHIHSGAVWFLKVSDQRVICSGSFGPVTDTCRANFWKKSPNWGSSVCSTNSCRSCASSVCPSDSTAPAGD